MSDIPNTETNYVAQSAIAWEMVKVWINKNPNFWNSSEEDKIKHLVNTYVDAIQGISNLKKME